MGMLGAIMLNFDIWTAEGGEHFHYKIHLIL